MKERYDWRLYRLVSQIYYLEGRTQKFFQILSAGKETAVDTYTAHKWLVKDRDTNKQLLIDNVKLFSPPPGYTAARRKRAYITIPREFFKPIAFIRQEFLRLS